MSAQAYGNFDQGFFNAGCRLIEEVVPRNYIYFNMEVDVSGMDERRVMARQDHILAPSYTAFVIKAAARALQDHPHLNCMIQERFFSTKLVRLPDVTATVAVERMVNDVDMVFAPMLPSPHQQTLSELTASMKHYAEVTPQREPAFADFLNLMKLARYLPTVVGWLFRVPALSPNLWRKYRGGAFAVTSPGKYGGPDAIMAPWPWPLTFLFGSVKQRPWIKNGKVVPCKTMRLTITADRRLANGAPLARFAEQIRQYLENPELIEPTTQTGSITDGKSVSEPIKAVSEWAYASNR